MQLDVCKAHLSRALCRALEHRGGHVNADHAAFGPSHLGGDQQICASAAAEVEHDGARFDATEQPVVGHAGEALHRRVRHVPQLGLGVAELLRPGSASCKEGERETREDSDEPDIHG